jgi:type IV secretory pathway TrbD component
MKTSEKVASRRIYVGIMLGTLAAIVLQNALAMNLALGVNVVIWICALHAMTQDIKQEERMKNE